MIFFHLLDKIWVFCSNILDLDKLPMEISTNQQEPWLVNYHVPLITIHWTIICLLGVGRWRTLDQSFVFVSKLWSPAHLRVICFYVASTGIRLQYLHSCLCSKLYLSIFTMYCVGYRDFLEPKVSIWAQILNISHLCSVQQPYTSKSYFCFNFLNFDIHQWNDFDFSVNLSHGTDACLHHQLIQYCE